MKAIHRYLSVVLSVALINISFGSVQAAMITNDRVISELSQQDEKVRLLQTISRADVAQRLLAWGVQPDDVEKRIELMTDEEVARLNQQIEELPAGGDLVGILLVIFIVFVITDVIGATDIFPFIKPVN